MAVVHRSLVKYFGVSQQAPLGGFELSGTATWVEHHTYGELHAAVQAACPRGFVCEEPLALFHEVQWRQRGPPTHALHHALEVGEYPLLWRPPPPSSSSAAAWGATAIIISICVMVHARPP